MPLPPLSFWEALWDFTGVFCCWEVGTRRRSPSPGVPSPVFVPSGRSRAGPGSPEISFLPADPEDVGCSPPLHHVSRINSQRACPGLGGRSVCSKMAGASVRNVRNYSNVIAEDPSCYSGVRILRVPSRQWI